MSQLSLSEAEAALQRVQAGGLLEEGEAALLVGVSRRLIVYGSLAPGGSNHRELEGIEGTWRRGWVTGTLVREGWGATLGYPALLWAPGGTRVPAYLLESETLEAHWARLDAFEGEAYRRLSIPFFPTDGPWLVGQLYAARVP